MTTAPSINLIPDNRDRLFIREIASRAAYIHRSRITLPNGVVHGEYIPVLEWERRIALCHLNGCPLNLAEFLNAPEAMFWYDAVQIRDNLDMQTGLMPPHACATMNFSTIRKPTT